jgi:hypothetical protein
MVVVCLTYISYRMDRNCHSPPTYRGCPWPAGLQLGYPPNWRGHTHVNVARQAPSSPPTPPTVSPISTSGSQMKQCSTLVRREHRSRAFWFYTTIYTIQFTIISRMTWKYYALIPIWLYCGIRQIHLRCVSVLQGIPYKIHVQVHLLL